ncbi:MAG TPA: PDZ domain-containing protein [Candidatus Polarisedimenticolia bacterium]|nr:PDZ domain-containing protein [Candidatus Polarisedimenticolia bacterium]
MKNVNRIGIAALALALALPAWAGHNGEKCNYPTQECLDHMAEKLKSSGWVGVELDYNEATGIPTVTKVVPGSPAEAAGIQPGDVFVALNGVKMIKDNEEALNAAKKEWKPGQSVTYTISHNGYDKKVDLTLAPMPADVMAVWIGKHMLMHANTQVADKK